MKIEQLEYVIEVAKAGSINSASEKLHIAQQSLNTSLKNLDEELGFAVFTKNNQGTYLTERGKLLEEAAHDILNRLEVLFEEIEQVKDHNSKSKRPVQGTIVLGSTPGVLEGLQEDIIDPFSDRYPNVTIQVENMEYVDIIEALKTGKADFGIMRLQDANNPVRPEIAQADSDISTHILLEAKMYLGVSKKLPIAKQKSISMSKALQYPFILYKIGDLEENLAYVWLRKYGTPYIALTTNVEYIYEKNIASGNVVGIYYCYKKIQFPPTKSQDIALVSIKVQDNQNVALIGYAYNNKAPMSQAASLLLEMLRNYQ